MTKFSDPAWWPTAPRRPPKAASAPMIVLGTLLPLALVGVVAALLLTHRGHHAKTAASRSFAAFYDCMQGQGADQPSFNSNARLMQLAANTCAAHLPRGIPVPDYSQPAQPAQDQQQAFQQCIRAALVGLGGGGGRFSRPSRQAFENAVSLCKAMTPGAPGQGRATA